ncbi:glycosyltransferase family 39 protein [Candidatus Dojkabacteria bacterium]|nr:glycosyltransferase family 39 protein [Candidatus Dojkabacteria bacterium]
MSKLKNLISRYSFLVVIIFVCLVLFSILLYRSTSYPYTHDESFTYLVHSKLSLKDILLYNGYCPANNHLINTLSVKFFSKVFGASEITGRLASLIAAIVYFASSFLLVKRYKDKFWAILSFIILNSSPYVFSYFALSRGYSWAVAFMLLSISLLLTGIKKHEEKLTFFSCIPAGISVIANFTMLSFFIPFIIVLFVRFFFNLWSKYKTQLIQKKSIAEIKQFLFPVSISLVLVLIFCVYPIYKLQLDGQLYYGVSPISKLPKDSQLYYGGNSSFWADTVNSLIFKSFGHLSSLDFILPFIRILIVSVLVLSVTYVVFHLFKKELNVFNSSVALVFFILLGCIIVNIAQHLILHSPFLIERTALFYITLFLLLLIEISAVLCNKLYNLRHLIKTIYFLICILSVANFYLFNLKKISDWQFDMNNKELIDYLISEHEKDRDGEIRLATSWLTDQSISYYKEIYGLDWLITNRYAREEDKINEYDYFYYDKYAYKDYSFKGLRLKVINNYEDSGYILSKKVAHNDYKSL